MHCDNSIIYADVVMEAYIGSFSFLDYMDKNLTIKRTPTSAYSSVDKEAKEWGDGIPFCNISKNNIEVKMVNVPNRKPYNVTLMHAGQSAQITIKIDETGYTFAVPLLPASERLDKNQIEKYRAARRFTLQENNNLALDFLIIINSSNLFRYLR
ncbi:hypothetical protein AAIR98_000792 [Elusimicrobium simillimum]|uniref:hypothetical protein n=1 Tax=Elusimicrobium simillimum TaxID=3143438 RepID=UPI003C703E5C